MKIILQTNIYQEGKIKLNYQAIKLYISKQ